MLLTLLNLLTNFTRLTRLNLLTNPTNAINLLNLLNLLYTHTHTHTHTRRTIGAGVCRMVERCLPVTPLRGGVGAASRTSIGRQEAPSPIT